MYHKRKVGKRNVSDVVIPIILMVLCIIMIHQVSAISGSGGGISVDANIGSLAYNGLGSIYNVYGSSSAIDGLFNNTYFSGRFGPSQNPYSDVNFISIELLTPFNDSARYGPNVIFVYTPVSNASQINNCSIYINGVLNTTEYIINNGTMNTITVNNLSIGKYFWNINCSNSGGAYSSSTRTLTILQSTIFDNSSTNLLQVNISVVPNLTLSQSANGMIVFPGITDLSNGVDFDSNIIIGDKSISVNSFALPVLNKPAILTMYNVPYPTVLIWKDSSICPDCSIVSLSSDTLVFNVAGFSTYTVTSTTSLSTFDDTDSIRIPKNESIIFYANYSKVVDGDSIIGDCDIAFSIDAWAPSSMTYDAGAKLYVYDRSFSDIGTDNYSISCTNSLGFDDLSVTETYTVSTDLPSSFSNIIANTGESSRSDENSSGTNMTSLAGNLTEIVFDGMAVSSSWQGYYGNITGQISLRDVNGSSFYNWNLALKRGEIYAARTPSIKWYTVHCADAAMLSIEDTYLGMNSSNDESLEKTFFTGRNFDTFYVGEIKINSSQNCYSTNLNDATGAQNNHFAQILLSDNNEMIYTGLIDDSVYGFDNRNHDFEMLVAENGENNNVITTYYFFLELG